MQKGSQCHCTDSLMSCPPGRAGYRLRRWRMNILRSGPGAGSGRMTPWALNWRLSDSERARDCLAFSREPAVMMTMPTTTAINPISDNTIETPGGAIAA